MSWRNGTSFLSVFLFLSRERYGGGKVTSTFDRGLLVWFLLVILLLCVCTLEIDTCNICILKSFFLWHINSSWLFLFGFHTVCMFVFRVSNYIVLYWMFQTGSWNAPTEVTRQCFEHFQVSFTCFDPYSKSVWCCKCVTCMQSQSPPKTCSTSGVYNSWWKSESLSELCAISGGSFEISNTQ